MFNAYDGVISIHQTLTINNNKSTMYVEHMKLFYTNNKDIFLLLNTITNIRARGDNSTIVGYLHVCVLIKGGLDITVCH